MPRVFPDYSRQNRKYCCREVMRMKKKKGLHFDPTPMTRGFMGQPDDCFELVNRYGTYNIQPTADTDNTFPAISQGMPHRLRKPNEDFNAVQKRP